MCSQLFWGTGSFFDFFADFEAGADKHGFAADKPRLGADKWCVAADKSSPAADNAKMEARSEDYQLKKLL
ncbi:hypothetical protein D9754_06650 [Planomicrobium sp. Y74]|nr:hypothetical protein D9754_06650 [Planomicrobium sp. Y74]